MNLKSPREKTIGHIRKLIWLYFWLLLLEGALRKWILPEFSNPLLIVRDPVVLLIYFLAIKAHVFPKNVWIVVLAATAFLTFAVSFVTLLPYLSPFYIALVGGFGFRSNFLHLPLILIMPRVLRAEDVKRFGWWTLVLVLPMVLLMVAQFRAAPDAFVNRTPGGEGEMMLSALGKVRTAGTFSFVIGVVAYFALASAFLIWAGLRKDVYRRWLIYAAGVALTIGIAVSGSRSVVAACALVVASLAIILFIAPKHVGRLGQALLATLVLGFIATRTPVFKEGFNVLSTRFMEVAEQTEKSIGRGMAERVFSDFGEGLYVFTKAPFLGYGLGIGTNAGAKFLTGHMMFLLAESEWSRIFLESGPVLGLGFVLWRCGMVAYAGYLSMRSARGGNLLPLLLFSAAVVPMLTGQFGQPTILGFAVFIMGLTLSARDLDGQVASAPALEAGKKTSPGVRRVKGRSAYANRLHGSDAPAPREHANGSVDR